MVGTIGHRSAVCSGGRHRRGALGVAILIGFCGMLLAASAQAGTLVGTVIGRAANPKPFVRIEIYGPQSTTVFSNKQGQFSIDLPGGTYRIQIIESNQGQQFTVSVPQQGSVQQTFQLSW